MCSNWSWLSPRGSALIANKVYLLPTTATSTRQSVLDPCLPSLCGPVMKVRMTVYTQWHTHDYTAQKTRGLAIKRMKIHSATVHTVHCDYTSESCIKHLLWHWHAVGACIAAHRCTSTHKVSHTIPLTALLWRPPGLFSFFSPTVLISQLRRGDNSVYSAQSTLVNEQDLYWIKHLVRIPNAHSAELNVSLRSKKRIKTGIY